MSYRMPSVLRQAQWEGARKRLGDEHPATRARFGRYVGSRGSVLSAVGSGREAWAACWRERGHAGFQNRSWRRRYLPATILGANRELTAV